MALMRSHFFTAEEWPRILEETNKLSDVLLMVQPDSRPPPPGFQAKPSSRNKARMMGIDCTEVYPNVFIGDGATVMKKKYLKRIGVSHVLNAAMGSAPYLVNTNAEYYAGAKIQFMGVQLNDNPSCHIAQYFEKAANFIDDALKSGGKVFVNCVCGISRSATFVIAFLMIKRFLTAESALRLLRSKRLIGPNNGFLAQIAALEFKLREEHADYPRIDEPPSTRIGSVTKIEKTLVKKCDIL